MFIVRSREDVFPAVKRLRSGKSVIVVPSMLSTFKYEACRKGIEFFITDFGWGYEITSKGGKND